MSKLTKDTLPNLKTQVAAFADQPCTDLISEKSGIEALFKKQHDVSKVLEMQWVVRRCLAEEKLPDAIQVLQAAQDMLKNVPEPPPLLAVSPKRTEPFGIEQFIPYIM